MRIRRCFSILFVILLCIILPSVAGAADEDLSFVSVPELIKPGQVVEIVIRAPKDGTASFLLVSDALQAVYFVQETCTLSAGDNVITWDGHLTSGDPLAVGEYVLCLQFEDGAMITQPVRIGVPYPQLTSIEQSHETLVADNMVTVSYAASEAGTLYMQLFRYADDTVIGESTMDVAAGENRFRWDGMMGGERVEDGEYAIVLSLRNGSGAESMQHYVYVDVTKASMELVDFNAITDQLIGAIQSDVIQLSPPYSEVDDGSFWSMTPGELDDAVIWDILMQPITVYDNGRIGSVGHVYMKENPDGTGADVAQIHGMSQGLHVIGETNEYGYVLVEAFSNYDPDYTPKTDEEKAHAFDLRRGYLKAEHLKTVDVATDIAFLVDKLTQRMYIFVDGVRVTELMISTGRIIDEKYFRETIAGEFITIGKSGGYWSNDLYSAYAIRFNGGTMLHEVPSTEGSDGTKYYGASEKYLGAKRSAGCVRVPRKRNEEGYNQAWIWDNLSGKNSYKIIIWDDINRYDVPETWR